MEAQSRLEEVRTFETRGGNTRFVVRDSDGNEYTTFREEIGNRAQQLRGRQVRSTTIAGLVINPSRRSSHTPMEISAVLPAPTTWNRPAEGS